ncbi:MAG: hypothetical protein ACI9BW_000091 [Gammaproteobacteria bacterium]|jgi:hypothetical protein
MASNSDSSRNSSGRRFDRGAGKLVEQWRYRGHTGRLIRRHRALRSLDIETSSVAHPFLLSVASIALVMLSSKAITNIWVNVIQFWCESIGLDAEITARSVVGIGGFYFEIPDVRIESPLPNADMLFYSSIIVGTAMLMAYAFLRRFLPLCYLVWAIGLIQIAALIHFAIYPQAFPYSIGTHVTSSLEMIFVLLFLLPILLMVAYYPLNFSLLKKIALTGVSLGMVIIFAPHLYTCHIVLMSHFSVLYMPVLFAAFGVFPIILMVIAIYGWGMSWTQRY